MSASHFPGDYQNSVPEPSVSSIVSHSFQMYRGILVYAVVAFLIFWAFNLAADAIMKFDLFFTLSSLEDTENVMNSIITSPGIAAYGMVSIVLSVLSSPLYVGLLYIMSKYNSNQTIEINDLFIGYTQNTVNILIYSLIAHTVLSIAAGLCFIPVFFVAPFFLLGLPILLFENATAVDALKKSFNLAKDQYGVFLLLGILGFFLSFMGVLVCFIGIIITGFYFVALIYSTYVAYLGKPRPLMGRN